MRTRPSTYWPIILGFPLAVLAGLLGRHALTLPDLYHRVVAAHKALQIPFLQADILGSVLVYGRVCGGAAIVFLITAFLVLFVTRGWVLWLYRKCCLTSYVLGLLAIMLINRATAILLENNISLDGGGVNPVTVFFVRLHLLWPVAAGMMLVGVLQVITLRRKVMALYTGIHDERPAPGDRVLENILSNGRDPRFRKSVLASIGLHIMVILVIPWLLTARGCVEPYRVPKGQGTPTVASSVKIVKQVKAKKKKKKFMLNPHSAISFHIPDLDDSKVNEQVEKDSQVTYVADPTRVLSQGRGSGGKMGAGGKGPGGWPDGMENAKVRFIRLEYNGAGWDDGMDAVSRADMNFLDEFRRQTGFTTAAQSESHPIAMLRKYPKGFAPPFVFMAGSGDINVTPGDVKILRDYLMDGGMLFADCGSPRWDRNFRNFILSVCPGEPLVEISDDDLIFQMPVVFANGAPPLWHHGGWRAMGVKHNGRWCVFYHPGDIHDAWKSGRTGMDPKMAAGAINMGVNIIYYSFTHYLELTHKYRK